jgi:hypothetical protein
MSVDTKNLKHIYNCALLGLNHTAAPLYMCFKSSVWTLTTSFQYCNYYYHVINIGQFSTINNASPTQKYVMRNSLCSQTMTQLQVATRLSLILYKLCMVLFCK